jgi:two-component system, NarL family, response regulator DegU
MEPSQPEISILLACQRKMFIDLYAQAFSLSPGFRVVACAESTSEALQAARTNVVHVALISASLKEAPLSGFHAIQQIQSACPGIKSVILLEHNEEHLATAAFRVGARGVFTPASGGFESLCRCVKQVHAGQVWANSAQLHQLLEAFSRRAPVQVVNAGGERLLTKREEEIVQLIQDGLTNRQVAKELKLSEHTVRNNLFRIFDKLGVSTRLELALYAINHSTPAVPMTAKRTVKSERVSPSIAPEAGSAAFD